jgi:morphogenetic protein associated with SpoVID
MDLFHRREIRVKIHIVQKGDTLWKIAKKYGVNFEELKKMNSQLSNPDMIMPGMKVKVPTSGGMIKKETPVGQKPAAGVNLGAKKEMPIAEHPFTKEKPKEMPIIQAPIKEAPIIKEAPKAPYTPKMPIIPEIDINNYYTMNMASMTVKEAPQLPPQPVVKEVPKQEVPPPAPVCPPPPVQQPICEPECVPITPIMPGTGFCPPVDPLMPYPPVAGAGMPFPSGSPIPAVPGVGPAAPGTAYIPPQFEDESSSFMPQISAMNPGFVPGGVGGQLPPGGIPVQPSYLPPGAPQVSAGNPGYPTGVYPGVGYPGYPEMQTGYPSGGYPGYPEMQAGYPGGGYSGYPEMQAGYPSGSYPGYPEGQSVNPGGYPGGSYPNTEIQGGYPGGFYPGNLGAPGGFPQAAYPTNYAVPSPGYPTGPYPGREPGEYAGSAYQGYPGGQQYPAQAFRPDFTNQAFYPPYGPPAGGMPNGQIPYGYPPTGPAKLNESTEAGTQFAGESPNPAHGGKLPVSTGNLGDCGCGTPQQEPQKFVPTTPPVYMAPFTAPSVDTQPPFMNPYGMGPMGTPYGYQRDEESDEADS